MLGAFGGHCVSGDGRQRTCDRRRELARVRPCTWHAWRTERCGGVLLRRLEPGHACGGHFLLGGCPGGDVTRATIGNALVDRIPSDRLRDSPKSAWPHGGLADDHLVG